MSDNNLPDQMTAVILDSYTGAGGLRVEQRPVPQPGANQVLIKVEASPINPSDLTFLEGRYGFRRSVPTVPGLEASGTVVAAGGNLMGRYLIGRRVACIASQDLDGVWAEYVCTSSSLALPLNDDVPFEQGSMSVVNPLSAISLIAIAKDGGHQTVINNAAASALGQMILRHGRSSGVQVINIVRRQEQVDLLRELGAELVLNSSDEDFTKRLTEACQEHQVRLAFDAVAGEMTFKLLNALKPGGRVTVYGGLSGAASQVNPQDLIFGGKRVDGFWLTSWMGRRNMFNNLMTWRQAQKLMLGELQTMVRSRYGLGDVRTAVSDYQQKMTGGKVLLIPGLSPENRPSPG